MTDPSWLLVPLTAEHSRAVAACHIACWREAYQGLVPDHVLAAFDMPRAAARWERLRMQRPGSTVVAVLGGGVIGFATAGVSRDDRPVSAREINAMYVRASWYGTGVAAELMAAVLRPELSTSLWVFEDNPRAQGFYRKYGFALDGTRKPEPFSAIPAVRMVRPADQTRQ